MKSAKDIIFYEEKGRGVTFLFVEYNDIRFIKNGQMTAAIQMEAFGKSQLF